jgi:prevent-host-death family protein
MKTVGVRELKNHLSAYLRRVRLGESVLVTDHGEVVAKLSPPSRGATGPSLPAALLALAKRGIVTSGALGERSLYPPIPCSMSVDATAARLLDEERASR